MKIIDLHCDLLAYLERDPSRTAEDSQARASIPQMRQGGIVLQVCAIFNLTEPKSEKSGERQFQIFKTLPKDICSMIAVENASGVCGEDEPLEIGLKRLENWSKERIAYLSFTWNHENRFGGGNASKTGIKPDGISLLKWMDGKRIAIDLSHTSDALAHDILNTLDKYRLNITPIASHSNFRKVMDNPRNLPDPFVLEIIRRNGVIGINFLRLFVGSNGPDDFLRHIEHAEQLKGLDHLCFGADFFYDGDSPPELDHLKPFFYEGFDNSSCYPRMVQLLRKKLPEEQIEKIAYKTLAKFFHLKK